MPCRSHRLGGELIVKPVAILTLDSRGWGPAYCEGCASDVEEGILMDDASFVCPGYMTPVKGFEDVFQAFVQAIPWPGDEAARQRFDEGR